MRTYVLRRLTLTVRLLSMLMFRFPPLPLSTFTRLFPFPLLRLVSRVLGLVTSEVRTPEDRSLLTERSFVDGRVLGLEEGVSRRLVDLL